MGHEEASPVGAYKKLFNAFKLVRAGSKVKEIPTADQEKEIVITHVEKLVRKPSRVRSGKDINYEAEEYIARTKKNFLVLATLHN